VSRADVIFFAGERATLAEILAAASERRDNQRSYSPPSGSMSKTIGKSSDNDIVLPNDDVSRRHAVIHKTPSGDVVIEDLNSTNGTFVNGQRVNVKSLTPGDSVSITRNYPLQWETLFSASAPAPIQSKPNRSWQKLAAVIVGVLLVAAAAFLLIPRSISKEELYKQYHSAVCWVYVKCGYQIMLDDDNITPTICRVLRVTPSKYVTVDESEGVIKPGIAEYEGTAFFISNDGKLATNLHITRPWLFDSTIEILEATANEIVAANVQYDPSLSRRKLKIVPEILYLAIIQDGLPISEGNLIECDEYNAGDDINKDVAIIQTKTRELPSKVERIIDIEKAVTDDDAYTVGRTVYTIGYPFGHMIGTNSENELKNQVHSGSTTQNLGEFEFGHDAETAGGASGSPIFDSKGRLIGVHHSGLTAYGAQGFNRGIKIKYAKDLLKK
jgi:S1-C subfamily serine protease